MYQAENSCIELEVHRRMFGKNFIPVQCCFHEFLVGQISVWFKLTETETEMSVNWFIWFQLTGTETETEMAKKLKLNRNWNGQNFNRNLNSKTEIQKLKLMAKYIKFPI